MSTSSLWWLVAGALVAAELATGTFYLLMIALGAAAGALAATAGAGPTAPWLVAAGVGAAATLGWHRWRAVHPAQALPAAADPGVNLDIGSRVVVAAWAPDGTARVTHRGAAWAARSAEGASARPGEHVIVAVDGNCLVLSTAAAR